MRASRGSLVALVATLRNVALAAGASAQVTFVPDTITARIGERLNVRDIGVRVHNPQDVPLVAVRIEVPDGVDYHAFLVSDLALEQGIVGAGGHSGAAWSSFELPAGATMEECKVLVSLRDVGRQSLGFPTYLTFSDSTVLAVTGPPGTPTAAPLLVVLGPQPLPTGLVATVGALLAIVLTGVAVKLLRRHRET